MSHWQSHIPILIDTSHGCNWDVSSVVVYRAKDVSALTPPDILTKDLLITGLCLPPPREPAEVINSPTHVPVATHGQTSQGKTRATQSAALELLCLDREILERGGAGLYGLTPGQAPPSSHQGEVLCVVPDSHPKQFILA